MPIVVASIIFGLNADLKVFDSILALNNGGPGTATTPLNLYMFQTSFLYSDYGYGSTIAMLITVLCLVGTAAGLPIVPPRVERGPDDDDRPRARRARLRPAVARGAPQPAGAQDARPGRRAAVAAHASTNVLVAIILIVEIYPLFWILTSSFKSAGRVQHAPLWSLPQHFDFGQLRRPRGAPRTSAQTRSTASPSRWCRWSSSSILGSAAAFALEVMVWRGRTSILLFVIGGLMVADPAHPAPAVHHLLQARHQQLAAAADHHLHRPGSAAHRVPDGDVLPQCPARAVRGLRARRGRRVPLLLLGRPAAGPQRHLHDGAAAVLLRSGTTCSSP